MIPLFKCELDYFHSSHLLQIYDGFEKLHKMGIIELSLKPCKGNSSIPILKVKVDNKYTVIYDTLDGLNWIKAPIEENLNYLKKSIKADFYFKRSYNSEVLKYAPENCKVFPLGLNVCFKADGKYPMNLDELYSNFKRSNYSITSYFQTYLFKSKDLECLPTPSKENKILFMTRLFDPNDVTLEHLREERETLNKNRIRYINACKKEFGNQFTGGLQKNAFAVENYKSLIIPDHLTNRKAFLNTVENTNICVTTTGLHNSIGWKFGEFVSASRAIVAETLKYDLPGGFESQKNYLNFDNEEQFFTSVHSLLNNKDQITEMMNANYKYYNNYLRPDKLVYNTLLKIHETI